MNTKRTPDLDDLEPDVRATLIAFRDKHGRYWRMKLLDLWQSGKDEGHLRVIRNNQGPTWLRKLKD